MAVTNFVNADYYSAQKAKTYIDAKNSSVANALSAIQTWMGNAESRIAALESSSGTGTNIDDLFSFALSDTYHISEDVDAAQVIANELNLSGFAARIGTSGITWKAPTIYVPTITWSSSVDENYDLTANVPISVNFGSLGSIGKTVTFKKPGEGKLYAVKLSNGNSSIDTGIAADYSYTLHAKGWGREDGTSVLIGGFSTTSARTSLRILPTSNKLQSQWANNVEHTNAQTGLQVTSVFEYWQKANYLRLVQGSLDVTVNPGGNTTSGNPGSNIYLLGDDAASTRGYGVLVFAEILSESDTQVAYFAPYKLHDGEIVIINTSGLTAQQIYDIVENGNNSTNASRIRRPRNGTLIEVSVV